MNLTVVFVSNRDKPMLPWLVESLHSQTSKQDSISVIYVHPKNDESGWFGLFGNDLSSTAVKCVQPKPTFWSGQNRLTKADWWSKSNSLNTGICLCKTDWVSFVDDRAVLLPGWLDCVKEAIAGNYVMCGAYEKRVGMTVENGVIKHGGIVTGKDVREEYCEKYYSPPQHGLKPPYKADRAWAFGCSLALPLEWALTVGGFSEDYCDGLGSEDTMFGLCLANNGFPMRYDPRCKIVEDRTPTEIVPVALRTDKGVSPNDKSHKVLDLFQKSKTSMNSFDIRELRKNIQNGKPWPKPSASSKDWFDGQPLSEMT